jgi:hypothetical protein
MMDRSELVVGRWQLARAVSGATAKLRKESADRPKMRASSRSSCNDRPGQSMEATEGMPPPVRLASLAGWCRRDDSLATT